ADAHAVVPGRAERLALVVTNGDRLHGTAGRGDRQRVRRRARRAHVAAELPVGVGVGGKKKKGDREEERPGPFEPGESAKAIEAHSSVAELYPLPAAVA